MMLEESYVIMRENGNDYISKGWSPWLMAEINAYKNNIEDIRKDLLKKASSDNEKVKRRKSYRELRKEAYLIRIKDDDIQYYDSKKQRFISF